MEKPTLEKYGLMQKDVDDYLKRKELFELEYKKHLETNKKISYSIAVILTILSFILLTTFLNERSIGDRIGMAIILMAFFVFPIIVLVSFMLCNNLDKEKEIKAKYISNTLEDKYTKYNNDLNKYLHYLEQNSRNYWIQMTGLQFEKEVASLFSAKGYDATVTPATADGGVDIVLRKNGERIAVQCKHHSKPVGPNDVRALQGVVAAQNYSKGIFVSLNGYTSSVCCEVRSGSVRIELLELKDILQMAKGDDINPVEPPNKPKPQKNELKKDEPIISLTNIDLEKQRKKQLIKRLIKKLYQSWGDKNIELILGEHVNHKEFGNGTIVSTKDHRDKGSKYIDVYFADIAKKKTFVFPSAFVDKHISLVNFKNTQKD